jgi:hypothetical protein
MRVTHRRIPAGIGLFLTFATLLFGFVASPASAQTAGPRIATTGQVSGRMVDGSGNGIAGVAVFVGASGSVTGPDGSFLLLGAPAGTQTFVATAAYNPALPDYGEYRTTIVVPAGGSYAMGDRLLPVRGALTGVTTDGGGGFVAGAAVTVTPLGQTVAVAATVTGSDGSFLVRRLLSGLYIVSVSGSGRTASRFVSVTEASVTDLGAIALDVVGSVHGVVRDAASAPVAGAVVTLGTAPSPVSATTAADGSYTLPSVAPGTYTAVASKAGSTSDTRAGIVVVGGSVTAQDFTLAAAGSITGQAKGPSGTGVALARIDLLRDGVVVGGTYTGPDGRYTLVDVAPGTYQLRATAPAATGLGSTVVPPFTVGAGGTVTQDIALYEARRSRWPRRRSPPSCRSSPSA